MVDSTIKDVLSDMEIKKIEQFSKDEKMVKAVRKVLLQGLYEHGVVGKDYVIDPLQNGAFHLASLAVQNPVPNEEIGANVRAMFAGLNAMKNAFDTLATIKVEKEAVLSEYNEAV
jgi:hypothetical protein